MHHGIPLLLLLLILLPSHFPPKVGPIFCAPSSENAVFNYSQRSAAEKTLKGQGIWGEEGGYGGGGGWGVRT